MKVYIVMKETGDCPSNYSCDVDGVFETLSKAEGYILSQTPTLYYNTEYYIHEWDVE